MAGPTPISSAERPTGRVGEPTARRVPPTSDGPGQIHVASFSGGTVHEWDGDAAVAALPDLCRQPETPTWVDLVSPSAGQVEAVGATLGLHPLIVEDILEGNQRAKIETTDGVVHLVLFALTQGGEKYRATEIDAVLGRGFLLTVHDASWDARSTNHVEGDGLGPILAKGPDHLLWALSDAIVDGYFPFADDLGEAIDEVQDRILRETTPASLERLFALKRELLEVRRATGPTREVFNQLTNRDVELIDEAELVYFRDVYDHVIRLTDEMDNYRELASSTLDVYLTQVNNNLSVIMKRLTGVTVILAGIGAVAGIFGMSEAGNALSGGEANGFWLVTAIVVAIAVGAAVILRRIDWI